MIAEFNGPNVYSCLKHTHARIHTCMHDHTHSAVYQLVKVNRKTVCQLTSDWVPVVALQRLVHGISHTWVLISNHNQPDMQKISTKCCISLFKVEWCSDVINVRFQGKDIQNIIGHFLNSSFNDWILLLWTSLTAVPGDHLHTHSLTETEMLLSRHTWATRSPCSLPNISCAPNKYGIY